MKRSSRRLCANLDRRDRLRDAASHRQLTHLPAEHAAFIMLVKPALAQVRRPHDVHQSYATEAVRQTT